ncbi:MAG: hypothetical protein K6T65_16820 [Peptococcaceae bacterium]|nr:hypothetical protein [Peptococcaceae bacterium]
MRRIVCECCTKQILPGTGVPDAYVTYGPVVRLCANQYVCAQCATDLDEDGLFPEEREKVELVEKLLKTVM